MRRCICGELHSVVDYKHDLNKPVTEDDMLDSKDRFHFTVYTKDDFMGYLSDKFLSGNRTVVFIDGEDNYPHVIIDKKEITEEDLKWINQEYKTWLEKH